MVEQEIEPHMAACYLSALVNFHLTRVEAQKNMAADSYVCIGNGSALMVEMIPGDPSGVKWIEFHPVTLFASISSWTPAV